MPNCYYYDEQRNRCNCYVNENLNELLSENAKLRELLREMYEDQCCDGDQWKYRGRMSELGVEVN